MKDKGLDKGLIREFNASDRDKRGWGKNFFGFRKMFWDYLTKLNVPFYDACCADASEGDGSPVRMTEELEYFNTSTKEWTPVPTNDSPTFDSISSDDVTTGQIDTDVIASNDNSFITADDIIVQKRSATAVNVTATTTAAAIAGGLITSTSAAAVTLTLPLSTDLATYISAVQGTSIDFMVDNSAGANTVTVTPNTGTTAVTAVITGGATMTVASGAVGTFRIFYTSATVSKIARLI